MALQERRRITLLNIEQLFDLWVQHYAKVAESDKQLLPLKPIYYLASLELEETHDQTTHELRDKLKEELKVWHESDQARSWTNASREFSMATKGN